MPARRNKGSGWKPGRGPAHARKGAAAPAEGRRPPLQENVPLAPLTTIGLGGPARHFADAGSVEACRAALAWARDAGVAVHLMGGGSNVVFADDGFRGLVLRVGCRGRAFRPAGRGTVLAEAAAGEEWDDFVRECVGRGLGGLECLSGIPGRAGAAPIQNVGAYGQEVGETIERVCAIDRRTLKDVEFTGSACGFRYRGSRFKGPDRGRYAITSVAFRLPSGARPRVRYADLERELESRGAPPASLPAGREGLDAVREAVLAVRRRKSMLLDPADPDARSVGSFFENPVLGLEAFRALEARWREGGGTEAVPSFEAEGAGGSRKVAAAWLIEQAGFPKGLRRGGVGISSRHALALVNAGGTARELMALAEEIRAGVWRRFGVALELEPDVVG
jgi:UDP-N-acetylmuramate dehydrogenase